MRHAALPARHRAVAGAWAAVALLIAAAIALSVLPFPTQGEGAVAKDMNGNLVAPLPGSTPDVAKVSSMRVVEQQDNDRFIVPSVGLDVPLGALDDVDGVITPPGFTSAYRVRNKGVSLSQARAGTVFVVMHSLMGGGMGPGNYLIDAERGSSRVSNGAVVHVAGLGYKVTGSMAIKRGQLADRADVWRNAPDRLVIITCLLTRGGNAPVDNMVITATRIP